MSKLFSQVTSVKLISGYQLHIPGEDSSYMGEGKIITIPATRIGSTSISAYCVLISELPRKTQQSSTGWTMLWLTWRRDSKVSSNRVQVHSQKAPLSRFPRQLMQHGLFMRTLLVTRQKETSSSPLESEILIVEDAWRPLMHMLMQQKKTQLAWNRKHIPTQGDKPCTGYVYSLSFGKEISDLRPILT